MTACHPSRWILLARSPILDRQHGHACGLNRSAQHFLKSLRRIGVGGDQGLMLSPVEVDEVRARTDLDAIAGKLNG
jgi:hypothetical protein